MMYMNPLIINIMIWQKLINFEQTSDLTSEMEEVLLAGKKSYFGNNTKYDKRTWGSMLFEIFGN